MTPPAGVGERLAVTVGPVAHGGHWVARADDGRVVFVRHALTGERVLAEVTEEHPGYLRADTVELLSAPAEARVTPPCRFARFRGELAGPHREPCGGCDFQHVAPEHQLALKAAVVREQLARLAGIHDLGVRVEPLPGGPLGWRSRVRYAVDATGRAGLLAHRTHQVVPVDRCLIAHPAVQEADVTARLWPDDDEVSVVASTGGDVTRSGDFVRERAAGRVWTIPAGVFWQVHPAAPDAFVDAVLDLLDPRPTDRAWDLYGGVGLFAAALSPRVSSVTLVESDPVAVRAAGTCLADLSNVHIVRSTVERFRAAEPVDVVVLDPPRSGAGARVVRAIAAAGPRAVTYVACDPAAFARDVGTLRGLGWRLAALRCFDAFPMTHHVESIGLLLPPEA
ncbi:MAG TPA: TRAM domain-containing protein, partial [Rugosimonospora sp.]|nr:TRAM domain-containing protein [Rugosimonospora sp.]